ncbi:unnamed protein product [Camellia sinensis]
MDKLNRNFLWGDTSDKKKVHLIKWDKVCRKKDYGGLGIRRARDHNLALIAKLGWKLVSDDNGLWTEVLKAKYLKHHTVQSWSRKGQASLIWRGIMKSRSLLKKGVKWTIGNGAKVRIWYDWWYGDRPWVEAVPNHSLTNSNTVDTLLDLEGQWDMHAINTLVPPELVHEILKIHLPRWVNLTDTPSWQGSTDGGFSSATAYDLLQAHSPNVTHWKWVWKLKIPQKFKGFLWLVLPGKLLTNCMRLKRGITTDPSCPSCGGIEDLNHVLRACPVAMEVWSTIFG